MIQGKEIKIGNYLKDRGGKVLRVDFIEYVENGFDTKFGQKMFVEGQEVHPMTEYSDYAEPIKLSGEWLEKLGFIGNELSIQPNVYVYHNGSVYIRGMSGAVHPRDVQYVHQLQNLVYAISGVELSAS
jgi:hypothetical protein